MYTKEQEAGFFHLTWLSENYTDLVALLLLFGKQTIIRTDVLSLAEPFLPVSSATFNLGQGELILALFGSGH